jgi:hypothetical protein
MLGALNGSLARAVSNRGVKTERRPEAITLLRGIICKKNYVAVIRDQTRGKSCHGDALSKYMTGL